QLSAFGATPWKWLEWIKRGVGFQTDLSPTEYRLQFHDQFAEVVEALGSRRLVILVDDLDRCRPENTVELLEAVNFLVSAAPCFVVMAFDRRWVTACVEIEYEKIATEVAKQGGAPEPKQAFAEQYLEKMVNLVVPVPKADLASFGRVLKLSDTVPP